MPTISSVTRVVTAVLGFALVLELAAAPSVLTQEVRDRRWRSDLEFLANQLQTRHPNLYHSLPRDRFRSELQRIETGIPALSDDDVVIALAQLLARVGDGHTLVPLVWDHTLGYGRLPVEFVRTWDGLSVLAVDSNLRNLAGARVLRIGSLATAVALDSLETVISRDNEWTADARAAEYAAVPEILEELGISASADSVRLVVVGGAEDQQEIFLKRIERDTPLVWGYGAYGDSAPWLARRDDPYWLTVLPDDSIAYVQFNRADRDKEGESLAAFGRRLLGLVSAGSVQRIVVDLRWNRGGSRWRARHLLNALIAAEYALGNPRSSRTRNPSGHLVTLIGPNTFSAATQFALDLELHTNTAFIGSPTGGRPNGYGEVGRFRLPESGIEIRHSVYYHQAAHARDTRPAVFPDHRLLWTGQDVLAGRDPVLETAFEWRPLPSGAGELERRLREKGVEAALSWLRSLREDPAPRFQVTEADLNRLGYSLLQEDRPEAAAAVFLRNLEEHPWSANAHDSLADAYLRLGREREAERLLCLAFAIDPQFDRAVERGLDCATSSRRHGYR